MDSDALSTQARALLREGRWREALDLVRRFSGGSARVAQARWLALLEEPGSGWSVRDPATGRWAVYCVPGYDALCGCVVAPPPVAATGALSPAALASALPAWMRGRPPWRVPPGVLPEAQGRAFAALAEAYRDDPEVVRVADRALALLASWGPDGREPHNRRLARAALRVAQELPYVLDADGEQVVWPPDLTAVVGGDCDKLSVLLAAVYSRLGIAWRMAWLYQRGADADHFTLEAAPDAPERWLTAEASVRYAELGENPYEALERVQRGNTYPARVTL